MRYTIKNSGGLIDCGGTVSELGRKEYSIRFVANNVKAQAKLCELEDLEDEFGIGAIIILKALKNGIYRPMQDGITYFPPSKIKVTAHHIATDAGIIIYYDEYGETWALTKEELK